MIKQLKNQTYHSEYIIIRCRWQHCVIAIENCFFFWIVIVDSYNADWALTGIVSSPSAIVKLNEREIVAIDHINIDTDVMFIERRWNEWMINCELMFVVILDPYS